MSKAHATKDPTTSERINGKLNFAVSRLAHRKKYLEERLAITGDRAFVGQARNHMVQEVNALKIALGLLERQIDEEEERLKFARGLRKFKQEPERKP
jgi:hypothetical protein